MASKVSGSGRLMKSIPSWSALPRGPIPLRRIPLKDLHYLPKPAKLKTLMSMVDELLGPKPKA